MRMDIKTAEALTSEEARDTLLMFRHFGDDPLSIQESFRGLFPKKVAEALGEVRALRRRALVKFSRGLDMYFTRPLLEQASSEQVADYRALRFQKAGIKTVFDPCCGIGSDSIAMARLGIEVFASDKDPIALHFAKTNAEVYQANVNFSLADAAEEIPPAGAIFIDPSRRRGSRRIMDPHDWSPTPEQVCALLKGRPGAGVKLSPATDLDVLLEMFPEPDEIEVVSLKGEAKETVFWYGCLAGSLGRRATSLPAGVSFAHEAKPKAPVGEIGAFIFDPDPALVRAGLLGAFAEANGLHVLDPLIGYLSGPKPVDSPFLAGFKVLAHETLDPRKMKAKMREFEVGRLIIRKRGIAEGPTALEKRFLPKTFGKREITLLATRLGDRHIGILAEPID
jgi:SAM-dependent methyltransferase